MRTSKFTTNPGASYMENPRNHTYNQMAAVENFHLVKRVMSVRPSIKNQRPKQCTHLVNSNVHRAPSASLNLRFPHQSSQNQFKRLEQHKENQVLLHKMLKIMERPLVSKVTSFQHMRRVTNNTVSYNRNELNSSRCSSKRSTLSAKNKKRPGSGQSSRGRNTPTSGLGPVSLNLSQRKRELQEISRQNFRMVNSLVQVKPQVPLASTLDKWSSQQGSYSKRISCVRYGTPKPL